MAEETTTAGSIVLTPAESKFLLTAMAHLRGPINFDFEAIATELGLKDATTARARWNNIKRAKLSSGASGGDTGAGVKKATATPKKKAKAGSEGGDAEDGGETPVKTPKKRGRKSKAEKAALEAAKVKEDGGDEGLEGDGVDGGVDGDRDV